MVTAAAGFKERFIEAVRLRLRADVPVGSCLSGGLDSSSIVCVANRLLREQDAQGAMIIVWATAGVAWMERSLRSVIQVLLAEMMIMAAQGQQRTFSACADVPRFDERSYIEIVVAYTGVKPHYTYPAQDTLFEILPDLTWHQDEPFGSTSIFAQWCVFALVAQQRVKVMLDGQGADEQLAGYHGYFGPYLAGLAKDLAIGSLWREWRAIRAQHSYSNVKLAKWMIGNLAPALIKPVAAILGQEHSDLTWLDLNCLGATPRDPFREGGVRTTSVQALSYAQLTTMNLQMLLHWEDRDSMAHSIESRVPFLDYRLVEYALGLPDECKIAAGITKRVLREGMRSILPEAIRQRMDKLGFVTPEEIWVRERSTARFRAALEDAITVSQGVLTSTALDRFDAMVSGKRPFNFFIWRLISFGAWVKQFGVALG